MPTRWSGNFSCVSLELHFSLSSFQSIRKGKRNNSQDNEDCNKFRKTLPLCAPLCSHHPGVFVLIAIRIRIETSQSRTERDGGRAETEINCIREKWNIFFDFCNLITTFLLSISTICSIILALFSFYFFPESYWVHYPWIALGIQEARIGW